MSLLDIGPEKFKSSSKIGIGRFCEVRKLTYYGSGHFERSMAFKTPLSHDRDNKDTLRSLDVEAAILSRITHSNVISVCDYSRERDRIGIFMECITGMDLKRISDHHTILPPEMILEIALRLTCALQAIHHMNDVGGKSLHVIHRDISLGNVMISEWGEVKIIDFGSATCRDFPQEASDLLFRGRMNYLPPEYLAGQTVDYRLDLFSMGVVLYRLAAGVFPFNGEDRDGLLIQMLQRKLEPPSRFNRQLGKREDELILKCLHPNPAKRFTDHLEILEMIRKSQIKRGLVERPGMLAYLLEKGH